MTAEDAELNARRRAAADPTGWFEQLYADAERGQAVVPWDRGRPSPILADWLSLRARPQPGERALVVGTGLGADAALLADLGWSVTAFDVSASAIAGARRRFPGSGVDFQVADLLDPPAEWATRFALVVEINTVQSLPPELHASAIAQVVGFVAGGGTLLVLASARDEHEIPEGPPWPLVEAEMRSFAAGDLTMVRFDEMREPGDIRRWLAELVRA